MDTSAVQAWADENLVSLIHRMGLSDWAIRVKYGPIDGDDAPAGTCQAYYKYFEADMCIDPAKVAGEASLKRLFEHELMHIHHSAYDMVDDYLKALLPDGVQSDRADVVLSYAAELTVKSLERLLKSQEEHYESHNPNQRERNAKRSSKRPKQVRNRNSKRR